MDLAYVRNDKLAKRADSLKGEGNVPECNGRLALREEIWKDWEENE